MQFVFALSRSCKVPAELTNFGNAAILNIWQQLHTVLIFTHGYSCKLLAVLVSFENNDFSLRLTKVANCKECLQTKSTQWFSQFGRTSSTRPLFQVAGSAGKSLNCRHASHLATVGNRQHSKTALELRPICALGHSCKLQAAPPNVERATVPRIWQPLQIASSASENRRTCDNSSHLSTAASC